MNLVSIYFASAMVIYIVSANSTDYQTHYAPSKSLNNFALKFLADINKYSKNSPNIVLSPYTVWSVLSVLSEGAFGNTAEELERVLGFPPQKEERDKFAVLQIDTMNKIMSKRKGVSLNIENAVFTRLEATLKPHFKDIASKLYKVDLESLDFKNATYAANYINERVSNVTKGRIDKIVNAEDVYEARMYVTSVLYFKGVWEQPFYKPATSKQLFYDDSNKVIANVSMMEDIGRYAFDSILNEHAEAIEIPYVGNMSMVVILPNTHTSLSNVLDMMAENDYSFPHILNTLRARSPKTEAKLKLPKFSISTDIVLNEILKNMGIQDIFHERLGDLRRMSDKSLYLSQISHKANIDVDESGTEGAAATVAEIVDKDGTIPVNKPVPFVVNRPFIYIIYDKLTDSMILTGTISNPNIP